MGHRLIGLERSRWSWHSSSSLESSTPTCAGFLDDKMSSSFFLTNAFPNEDPAPEPGARRARAAAPLFSSGRFVEAPGGPPTVCGNLSAALGGSSRDPGHRDQLRALTPDPEAGMAFVALVPAGADSGKRFVITDAAAKASREQLTAGDHGPLLKVPPGRRRMLLEVS